MKPMTAVERREIVRRAAEAGAFEPTYVAWLDGNVIEEREAVGNALVAIEDLLGPVPKDERKLLVWDALYGDVDMSENNDLVELIGSHLAFLDARRAYLAERGER